MKPVLIGPPGIGKRQGHLPNSPETEGVFYGQAAKRFPQDILKRAKMRLDRIDAASVLDDLRVPPSHHLQALQGDRLGQHSIRIMDLGAEAAEATQFHSP